MGLLLGAYVLPHSTATSPPPARFPVPSGLPPVTTCFGGGNCTAGVPTTNGSGTTCVIAGFSETASGFLYLAVNFAGGSDLILSVSDGGVDSFDFVAGEFANNQSVALYDVPSEHGGTVSITVTIGRTDFGACTAGQLSAGTKVGSIGAGYSVASGTGLSVFDDGSYAPSLQMALFGATRPTGNPFVTVAPQSGIAWNLANDWTGFTYDGTAQVLVGENDTASGGVTFTWTVGNTQTPSISGIAVQFYLGT